MENIIQYDYKTLLNYKSTKLANSLGQYAIQPNTNIQLNMRKQYMESMEKIIGAIKRGIKPNEYFIKNIIKENLNKLTKNNHQSMIAEFNKNKILTNNVYINILIDELIIKVYYDMVSIKDINNKESIVYIIINFVNNMDNNFKDIFNQKILDNYDKLVVNDIKNFDVLKRFINFFGVLYNNDYISLEQLEEKLNKLIELINSNLSERIKFLQLFEKLYTQLNLNNNNKNLLNKYKSKLDTSNFNIDEINIVNILLI